MAAAVPRQSLSGALARLACSVQVLCRAQRNINPTNLLILKSLSYCQGLALHLVYDEQDAAAVPSSSLWRLAWSQLLHSWQLFPLQRTPLSAPQSCGCNLHCAPSDLVLGPLSLAGVTGTSVDFGRDKMLALARR